MTPFIRQTVLMITAALLLFPLATVSPAGASGTVALCAGDAIIPLAGRVDYYEDTASAMTIGNITSPDIPWNAGGGSMKFGYTDSAFWFRVTLEDRSGGNARWLLEAGYPLDDVTLFTPRGDGTWRARASGFIHPIGQRDIRHRRILFTISPPPNRPFTCYLRVKTSTSMSVPLVVRERDAFAELDHDHSLAMGIFIGLIAAMLVYNLFFFIFLRDTTYLYYVLSIGGYLIFMLNLKGLDYEYLFGSTPGVVFGISPTLGAFAMFWAVVLEQRFLNTRETTPLWHRVLNVLLGVESLLFVTSLLWRHRIFGVIGNTITLIWIFCILATAVTAWIKKSRNAPYMLFAHTSTFLGVMFMSLRSLGILPASILTDYGHQIGFAISTVLLSIGMTGSIYRIRREKEKAQAESLEHVKRAAEIQELFVSHLETQVAERTSELNAACDDLRQKDEAIGRDIRIAKRIQERLLPVKAAGIDWSQFSIRYIPMYELGGDLYDVVKLSDGTIRIFLADATGHGIQAALLTMLIKSEYESVKLLYRELHEILMYMNNTFLSKYGSLDLIFTGIVLDIDPGRSVVRYVSAGHPTQFLLGPRGVRDIGHSGKLIGIDPDAAFETRELPFEAEDSLLLFTDGLFEEFNSGREELGFASFRQWVHECHGLETGEIVERLLNRTLEFIGDGDRNDDITVIGVRLRSLAETFRASSSSGGK
ncbi:MAG: SpoIIE family protein phosphatase [Spirochaetes bacterium]|nr:SpoIIE family protein phosphatase [Spirochaetota bacterium]